MTPSSPAVSVAPTRGRAIRVASGAVTITIVSVLPVFLVGGLAVQLREDLHFSRTALGAAVAVYFGVSALAAVPAGSLVERFGSAVTSRIAVVVSAVMLLVIAVWVRSYAGLLVALGLAATTNALGQLSSNLLLADGVPPHRQGLTFGIKQSAIPIATLLAGASVPAVALTVGWRWAFVLAAVAAAGVLALVPADARDPASRRAHRESQRATAGLVIVGVAATLAAGGANALGTFVVDSSVHRGLSPGLAGLMLTLGSAVCIAARLLGGALADRRGDDRLRVVAGLLCSGAVGLALLALPAAVALVAGVLLGFGLGWSWPGVMNFAVVRLNPQAPAAATSITQTGVYAGGCIGPLGFGLLADRVGYGPAWLVAAAALLVASGLMLFGRSILVRHRPGVPAPATPVAPSPG